jgi:hypothetical protein
VILVTVTNRVSSDNNLQVVFYHVRSTNLFKHRFVSSGRFLKLFRLSELLHCPRSSFLDSMFTFYLAKNPREILKQVDYIYII